MPTSVLSTIIMVGGFGVYSDVIIYQRQVVSVIKLGHLVCRYVGGCWSYRLAAFCIEAHIKEVECGQSH